MRPVVMAPSFPRRDSAADGQSIYVVESAQALAHLLGCSATDPLRAIALQLGDEPLCEVDGAVEILRVALPKGVNIASPFALYEAAHFETCMAQLATSGLHFIPPNAPVLVHGYELGPAAKRLVSQGNHVVAVLHYLLAQESEHYLASAEDALRADSMPRMLGALGRALPKGAREGAVQVASHLATSALPGHGLIAHQLRKLAHERMLMTSADVASGVSRGFAETMARFYPRARVTHCHAGAPSRAVRVGRMRYATKRLHFVTVGRPTPQKGWDVLAEALAILERERPALASRIELTLIGGVDVVSEAHSTFVRKTMQRLAELKQVRVNLRGRLGHHEVLAAYEEADVFVFPSDYEPFGLVLLEAMQAGLPVLAFDADGPRDVLTQASGWLVSRGDWTTRARRLAEAMAGLCACETYQLMAMGDAARARASEFTWSRCAAAHLHALGV